MKKLLIAAAVIASFGTGIANADVNLELSNTGDIELTGFIAPKCVIDLSKFNGHAVKLDLASDQSQAGPSVKTWCNTEVAPSVKFTSKYNGLKNVDSEKDEIIKYTAWWDGVGTLDFSGVEKVMPMKEYGKGMDYQQRPIRYTLQPTGYELAGNYEDTITIELLPN